MIVDGFFQWALGFLLVASLPFSGQLVGYVSYRLLRKHQDFVAHFVGAVVPPLGFFYHFKWFTEQVGFSREDAVMAPTGAAFQLLISITLQLALHSRHRPAREDVAKVIKEPPGSRPKGAR